MKTQTRQTLEKEHVSEPGRLLINNPVTMPLFQTAVNLATEELQTLTLVAVGYRLRLGTFQKEDSRKLVVKEPTETSLLRWHAGTTIMTCFVEQIRRKD